VRLVGSLRGFLDLGVRELVDNPAGMSFRWSLAAMTRVLAVAAMALLAAAVFLAVAGSVAARAGSSSVPILAVAGDGTACSTPPACGDGGAATAAELSFPEGVALGRGGDLYVADWGDNEVRTVSPGGTIHAVAGDGTPCARAPACGDGDAGTAAELSFPEGVAVDRAGNVYIADTGDNEIRKVSPSGTITRFAGTGVECSQPPACGDGGPATAAQLSAPAGVAVDQAGDVYVADSGDQEIREISRSGRIRRVAGVGTPCESAPSCGDRGPATSAQLSFPGGVAVDQKGDVYVADSGDNEVRMVAPSGTITVVAGDGTACSGPPSCGDGGEAGDAELSGPDGVAVDSAGNVFVADSGDNEVRRVSVSGEIATVAGQGSSCAQPPSCGDTGPATSAQLDYPDAVTADPQGDVYLADTFDQEIRWLPAGSAVTIQAGALRLVLSAFGATVARTTVTVRYALSGAAAVTLSVRGAGRLAVVAHAAGRAGFGQLVWNRRLDGVPAARGRYTLTVTATAGGHSGATALSVRL